MPETTKPTAVRNLRAPVAEALARLESDYTLAPELRAYLAARITASGHAGVTVNAHEHTAADGLHLHVSITKLY